jgi:glycosyltransferase involved in cell wall biosynthesis
MLEAIGIADLVRLETAEDGLLLVDDQRIDAALTALGLGSDGAAARVREILLTVIEDVSEDPLQIRVGSWSVRLPPKSFLQAVSSAVVVYAMESFGVTNVPVIVLAAVAPFLIKVDTARVDVTERVVVADLRTNASDEHARRRSWVDLPGDIRHEVPYPIYVELTEILGQATAQGGSHGQGGTSFRQSFDAPSARGRPRRARRIDIARSGRSPRVLMLCDEWFPSKGGLSAMNRLLSIGLVEAGAEVYCQVLSAISDEQADAKAAGVRLLQARATPGGTVQQALGRKPDLPDGVTPDIVVGHGRITGPYAKALVEDHYGGAFRFHVVHMAPDEIEWWKPISDEDPGTRADRRTKAELALARDAHCVAAIGPRLHRWMDRDLSVLDSPPRLIRLDPGFDGGDYRARVPPPGVPQILLLGRLDDVEIKGLDIAAKAVAHAVNLTGQHEPHVELLLRGAPVGQSADLRRAILAWSDLPSLQVTIRNYSTDREESRHDLRRASLLVMPSRVEGFGLVGVEAIMAGTPVLVSDQSGLGMLLAEMLPHAHAARTVVPIRNVEEDLFGGDMPWPPSCATGTRRSPTPWPCAM